jgi:hypothetical protein
VYVHRKADTNEIFYVGKGTILTRDRYARAYETRRRSDFWKATVAKHGFTPEIVLEFDDEDLAHRFEIDLIAHYVRRCDGGVLCNLTLGGEGQSGHAVSEATKEKLRIANGGVNAFNLGRKFPKEFGEKKTRTLLSGPHSPVGRKLPPEWRRNISRSKSGENNPQFGKNGIDHHRGHLVLLHGYNMVFGSIREAALFSGVSFATLQEHLTGKSKVNKTNMEII